MTDNSSLPERGLTWSGRWHYIDPARAVPPGWRSGRSVSVCGEWLHPVTDPRLPRHLQRAAGNPNTPMCKLCTKKAEAAK